MMHLLELQPCKYTTYGEILTRSTFWSLLILDKIAYVYLIHQYNILAKVYTYIHIHS